MTKQAILYRMVMPGQGCPFGLKAKALLEREGCTVDDKWMATRGARRHRRLQGGERRQDHSADSHRRQACRRLRRKAVYIDKRDIKCACVGGSSKVPLGAVSLTENLMMVAMALWMLALSVSS